MKILRTASLSVHFFFALSLKLYLPSLFPIKLLSHEVINFHVFNCEQHREKESSTMKTKNFRFLPASIMTGLKVGGQSKKLVITIMPDKIEMK